jgi:DNA-binding NtrC family response regulator
MISVLFCGKDKDLLDTALKAFRKQSYRFVHVSDWQSMFAEAEREKFHVAIVDVGVADKDALDLMTRLRERAGSTPAILIADSAPVDLVAEVVRAGAHEFLTKPVAEVQLSSVVDRVVERETMSSEVSYLRHTQDQIYRLDDIVCKGPEMHAVIETLRKVAPSDASVLILGETGTGKELVAGAIHYNSRRKGSPFIKVNCAALPETLLESELFGHEKGAFTGAHQRRIGRFEQANAGTIFLDEVADMSPGTQSKILRVLQEQTFERVGGMQAVYVDVRILAATNKDIKQLVAEGKFRDDLYYRLNVITLELPPLRERTADIPALVEFFATKFARELGYGAVDIDDGAMARMVEYSWPGNIRQLRNVLERAVIMAGSETITEQHLALESAEIPGRAAQADILGQPITLEEMERTVIERALRKAGGVQKKAAEMLGISPRVINYKIKKHNIKVEGGLN